MKNEMLNNIWMQLLDRKCEESRAKTSEPEYSINREFIRAKLAGLYNGTMGVAWRVSPSLKVFNSSERMAQYV